MKNKKNIFVILHIIAVCGIILLLSIKNAKSEEIIVIKNFTESNKIN
jgi:hypothetical protein